MKSWITRLLENCEARAKEINVPFSLTERTLAELWSQQNGKCFWFKIDLKTTDESFEPHEPARVSVDRLDNLKGYVKTNVVLSCYAANMGRGRTPAEKFGSYCEEMRESFTCKRCSR